MSACGVVATWTALVAAGKTERSARSSTRDWTGVLLVGDACALPQQQALIDGVFPQSCCLAAQIGCVRPANAGPVVVAMTATSSAIAERPVRADFTIASAKAGGVPVETTPIPTRNRHRRPAPAHYPAEVPDFPQC
jgi:hypothetical protein